MNRRTTLFVTALAWASLLASAAPAQPRLGVGLFAPELDIPADKRFTYAKALGQHLGAALGRPVEGQAYRSAADLERDVRANKIHFAAVGAIYMATRQGVTLLASARIRSPRDLVWSVMSQGKRRLAELEGKVLQVPSMGPLTDPFVENGILGGELRLASFFAVGRSPDLPSAIAALKLGKAAAVIAPVSTAGLQPVLAGLRIPEMAFVAFGKQPAKQIDAARRAILGYGAALGAVHGWRPGEVGEYRALARAAGRRQRTMQLARVEVARMNVGDVLAVNKQQRPELPQLEEMFWVP